MTFFKKREGDKIWWADMGDIEGQHVFSFDKQKTYNLFRDYPHALTEKQLAVFDAENPFWAKFFAARKEGMRDARR